MRVGYLQFEPEFGKTQKNIKTVLNMLEPIKADLIVLPELFNTGYYITSNKELKELGETFPGGYTCKKIENYSIKTKTFIVAGVLEREKDKYYNSAVLFGEKGYIDTYRKIHLFNEEKLFFTPGDKPFRVYDIGKCRIGIMICYDWIYPESMRVLSLLGADIVCHATNLVMPYCPDIMPSRCFDNKVFAITSNRYGKDVKGDKVQNFIGKSQIVSPKGEIIKRSGNNEKVVEIFDINPKEARNKALNSYNNLFEDRRTDMYKILTMPYQEIKNKFLANKTY